IFDQPDFPATSKLSEDRVRDEDKGKASASEEVDQLRNLLAEMHQVSSALLKEMSGPLRTAKQFAAFLHEQAEDLDSLEQKREVLLIASGAHRASKLVQQLLAYYATVFQPLPLQAVNLSKLLAELTTTDPDFGADMCDIRIRTSLPTVLGNEALLRLCFSNLL